MKKKIVSILMTLMMALSLLPVSSFATDTPTFKNVTAAVTDANSVTIKGQVESGAPGDKVITLRIVDSQSRDILADQVTTTGNFTFGAYQLAAGKYDYYLGGIGQTSKYSFALGQVATPVPTPTPVPEPTPTPVQQEVTSGQTVTLTTAPVAITIPAGVSNAKLQVAAVDQSANTAVLPLVNVQAQTPQGQVQVTIPEGTTVTGPAGWDGTITLPVLLANNSVNLSNGSVNTVVEVGVPEVPLTFTKAVRVLLPGQAGKSAAYIRGNNPPVEITKVLSADDQDIANGELADNEEGKIDVGADLVIWTKHFTKFIAYTPTINGGFDSDNNGSTGNGSNSGRRGSSGGGSSNSSVVEPGSTTEEKGTDVVNVALTDITGHWAQSTISQMVAKGVAKGYPDGTFRPNNNITRAEFAVMLVRAFQLEAKEGKVFEDTANHWAKQDIATAVSYGIANGYNATTFGPNDLITREQMAAMVVKAAKLTSVTEEISFADKLSISAWAKESIATATKYGIMKGYLDNTVRPKANATRAEAVTVIFNALK